MLLLETLLLLLKTLLLLLGSLLEMAQPVDIGNGVTAVHAPVLSQMWLVRLRIHNWASPYPDLIMISR